MQQPRSINVKQHCEHTAGIVQQTFLRIFPFNQQVSIRGLLIFFIFSASDLLILYEALVFPV